jgi:hypothetical protein
VKVFLMNPARPLRRVRQIDCAIKVCARTVWAIEPDGRRHLMGSSAFLTQPAAERAQRGCVQRVIDDKWVFKRKPEIHNYARQVAAALDGRALH